MNLYLPAEAPLDLYKAAYALYLRNNLRLCDLQFIYPHKGFSVHKSDILIGVHLDRVQQNTLFLSFEDVLNYLGDTSEFNFLRQIPDDIIYGFRERDRTLMANKLFNFFTNYKQSMVELSNVESLLSDHIVMEVGRHKIVIQNDTIFLSPEERVLLFRNGYHYVIFNSRPQVGIQKNLQRKVPSLQKFADHAHLSDKSTWFIHRKGHLVLSREAYSKDSLVEQFIKFLEAIADPDGQPAQ